MNDSDEIFSSDEGEQNTNNDVSEDFDEEDTFKILLATDIHLGYKEKDAIRGEDTFRTFNEILEIAKENEVDFILLGGDLFHETNPSSYCINTCIQLLRKYSLGEKPVTFEILSNQSENFRSSLNQSVNYEDPNLNVGIPVFSIHGNHDDPTGIKQISALDILSSTGLVNYFGRWDDLSKVEINPILLKKGNSFLALYGLSHLSDERLGRLFLEEKVTLLRPEDGATNFFNMLVLHQNRASRGAKNYVPYHCLPSDIDLVMWGHEHDCKLTPEPHGDTYITQPGSSVATSLTGGEAITKKVGILLVNKKRFKINEIELKTVRPLIFDELLLDLKKTPLSKQQEQAKLMIMNQIELMIGKSSMLNRIPEGILPLIRLKVFYTKDEQVFNKNKFSLQYTTQVANPEDMLLFQNCTGSVVRKQHIVFDDNKAEQPQYTFRHVVDFINQHFADDKNPLQVLSVPGLNASVDKILETNDAGAAQRIINHQFTKTLNKLKEAKTEEVDIAEFLSDLRHLRTANPENQANEDWQEVLENNVEVQSNDEYMSVTSTSQDIFHDAASNLARGSSTSIEIPDSDDESGIGTGRSPASRPLTGPGSRGGRGSRAARGAKAGERGSARGKRARGKAQPIF